MLALSSTAQALRALAEARRVAVAAYTLHGRALRATESAAERGADVTVWLEGHPYNDPGGRLAAENRRLAAELRAAGAAVVLGHPLHAKEIVADGTLYLDEKNWDAGDLVVREDDPAQARAIPGLKDRALDEEARLLAEAGRGDEVIVESEAFGCCNAVSGALERLAASGVAPHLLVSERELRGNPREQRALERLARDGVAVRVCRDTEKLALAGDRAWLGSANATWASGAADSTDWGVRTGNAEIVAAVARRLETQWRKAKPLVCQRA
jgi:phosphatidylserine/phosphatidylglycerophosphate/cardiolipin synthase-like enzyme